MESIIFQSKQVTLLTIIALIAKLGSKVFITQSDIDANAYSVLEEIETDDGVQLTIIQRTNNG